MLWKYLISGSLGMRRNNKPVHNCYSCLLNLDDHCWLYDYPRGQWRGNKTCRAFENDEIYGQYRDWKKQPTVKTGKELRRKVFRTRKPAYSFKTFAKISGKAQG